MGFTLIQTIAIWALPILFAITVHEVAHGWVASKLGDQTAKMLGRLTLNPIKHMDLFGTIIIPIILLSLGGFIFGWAKPVPVNPKNLRHPKRDMAFVSAAGIAANFLMAIIWALLAKLSLFLVHLGWHQVVLLFYMGQAGISINLWLMVFNLLPIPPLDGSHIIMAFLPDKWSYRYGQLSRYGLVILLLLLAFGVFNKVLLPFMIFIQRIFSTFFGLPF
ncbi:MAG: site-2 protease family protein [Gammaproteobacteria bacterium]|nr:site-2 protease family protein [Gammaproteobacteria bacterium]